MNYIQLKSCVPSRNTSTFSAPTLCEPSVEIHTVVNLGYVLILCCFLVVNSHVLLAQSNVGNSMNKLSAGLNINAALNLHRGQLTTNEGVLECGTFQNATTVGWTIGNYANIPLSDAISLAPNLYYHKAKGAFASPNSVQPLIALSDGSTTALSTEHTLDVSLDYVTLDIAARYYVNDRFYAMFGPSVGLATRNAFEQQESILSPVGATFLDGSSTRRIAAGNFTDSRGNLASNQIRISVLGGVGMMFPISTSFILNPEISFQYSIFNVINTTDWKVHTLRAGVGLLYVLSSPPPPVTPIPEDKKIEPAVVVIPPPVALLDVQNVEHDGTTLNYAEVTVNQHRTLDILPLLPYIFFDAKSDALSERYKTLAQSESSTFTESQLSNNQLEVYHDVLNIIGSRMNRYSNSTITITGCVEPKDDSNDKGLASRRAVSVRRYLHDVWGISDDRIIVRSRELPEITSTRRIPDGKAENRRAEIVASDPRILAPVYVKNAKNTIAPSALQLQPNVVYQGQVKQTDYRIKDNTGKTLYTTTQNNADKVSVPMNSVTINEPSKPLVASVTITTEDGRTTTAERPIPVRRTFTSSRGNAQVVKDTLIERYSMILFNFDRSSTIASNNDQILSLIRSRIRTSSNLNIEGMTDYIGRSKNNQRLSKSRATAVENSITSFIKPVTVNTKGLGEVNLFDDTVPEGRFYNRRVFVEIETPLNTDLDDEGELR